MIRFLHNNLKHVKLVVILTAQLLGLNDSMVQYQWGHTYHVTGILRSLPFRVMPVLEMEGAAMS